MGSDRRPLFRVPPPAIFIFVFLIALWIEAAVYRIWLVPDVQTPRALVFSGGALMLLGAALALWAAVWFRRSQTPIMPYQRATKIVVAGPYGYSRNPMYVGLALIHVGASIALNAAWPILLLPVALMLLYFLVIRAEEAMLAESFGEEYESYRGRVRRWL